MELLETQDPEKKKLIETSNRHRREMERELKDLSDRSEKILKNALIIGGALALTYVVVNQLSSSKTKKKKTKKNRDDASVIAVEQEEQEPSLLSRISEKAISVASVLLLDLAKEKLSEYLQPRKSKNGNS